jgi:hypothetical protein
VPELVRYEVEIETRVVIRASGSADGGVVGEYVVRSTPPLTMSSGKPNAIPSLVDQAMAKNAKAAKTMAAGVDNTERTRLR